MTRRIASACAGDPPRSRPQAHIRVVARLSTTLCCRRVQIEEVRHLLALQCGVIARRQVLEAGGTDNDIQRLIRRRQWARVHEGVYVDHTGPLSPIQRDWAAVLYAWPAALAGRDALRAHGVRGFEAAAGGVVDVVVPASRRVISQPGVRVRRLATFETDVQANLSPPRVRLEPAVLEVAASAPGEDAAVGVLSDVCQARRTTCPRLLVALDGRERIRHRRLLLLILRDVATGAFSALERRFLVSVERAHGLPTGARQRRVTVGRRPYFRDVEYRRLHTIVELDGRIGHTSVDDRWGDLERDLLAAVHGDLTVRVGWLQVLEAHRLAAALGALLTARGWRGEVRPCGPDCSVPRGGGSPAPDAGDPPR